MLKQLTTYTSEGYWSIIPGLLLSPFLKIGTIFAVFHSVGICFAGPEVSWDQFLG